MRCGLSVNFFFPSRKISDTWETGCCDWSTPAGVACREVDWGGATEAVGTVGALCEWSAQRLQRDGRPQATVKTGGSPSSRSSKFHRGRGGIHTSVFGGVCST